MKASERWKSGVRRKKIAAFVFLQRFTAKDLKVLFLLLIFHIQIWIKVVARFHLHR